jgi:hypothetical protein
MKSLKWILFVIALTWCVKISCQNNVTVTITVSEGQRLISPFIYGRNNSLSDSPVNPLSQSDWQKLRDAGVTIFRESGGNNGTKYNWKKKMSSHPDWYNNVYAHDWDFAAKSLQQSIPSAQGLWSFQLLGRVASDNQHNFNDWGYNQSQWWSGVSQNLAGGGQPNPAGGSDALVEGDYTLYTRTWPADSTVGILDHWFGENGLGLDKNKVLYWNMDNEVEIWSSTHDDVMPTQITAEAFMQLYFDVAKKARAKFPDIKLVGPVTCNEWQWFNYDNNSISYGGKNYCWLEYFIKRIGEEQQASGIRLLDVLDVHFYPGSKTADQLVQYHRVYFDKEYIFPEANGVKRVNGGWDNNINKEYIFERCRTWLETYVGANNGVKFGISETGINEVNPSVTSVWYASTLGEFMKNDVELFCPWTWLKGMWEVLHLYSRYNKSLSVKAVSDQEEYVSAYPSVNATKDSLTIILVNRSTDAAKNVTVNPSDFILDNVEHDVLQLSSLPSSETFISHSNNALKKSKIAASANSLSISLPPLSVTGIILSGIVGQPFAINDINGQLSAFEFFPNPVTDSKQITIHSEINGPVTYTLFNATGITLKSISSDCVQNQTIVFDLSDLSLPGGIYYLEMKTSGRSQTRKMIVLH